MTGIARLIGTPDGRKLIDRLKDALFNRKEDPTLFRDLVQALGGGIAGYASFILGVVSEASGIVGGAGVTGVAIPLKAESKIKWFSGVEVAKGASIKVGTGLIFGQKTEEPTHLTGQFYAGHTGAELGVSLGSTIFFDTADALNFKGFVTTVGIGIGLPVEVSVVRGWELVTSD